MNGWSRLLYDHPSGRLTLSVPKSGVKDTIENVDGVEYKGSQDVDVEVTASHAIFRFKDRVNIEIEETENTRNVIVKDR